MSAFISNIRQNTEYFCKKAMQAFEEQNYLLSIKYLNEAEKVADKREIYEIYFIQGLMYSKIEQYERSNEYFLLSTFSMPLQVKAFSAVVENMLALKRFDLAENYLTLLSYHPAIKKEELDAITQRFDKDIEKNKPKLREVSIEDDPKFIEDYTHALDMLYEGHFDKAIDIMSSYDYKKSAKTKDILTKSYSLNNQYDIAEQVATSSKLSINDKCNLILCYFFAGEEQKKNNLIKELKNNKYLTNEEMYRYAVVLAKIGENLLSIEAFENYFKKEPYDDYARIVYAMVCMDSEMFSKAKDTLIRFKPLELFDSGIYEELLVKCESKESVSYINHMDIWSLIDGKYKARIKWLLDQSEEKFAEIASLYKKEILWLATYKDKYLRNLFFTRYAKLEGNQDILDKILVSSEVDDGTKLIIIKQRLDSGINNNIIFTKDEVLVGFMALEYDLAKDKTYYKAYSLLVSKVLDSKERGLFDFSYFIRRIANIYKDSVENPYILAAIITWEIDKKIKRKTIKSTCKYFGVSEEDFWKYYKGD